MNRRQLQANVLRGVRLLDEKDSYWWNGQNTPPMIEGMVGHIDLEKLDLSHGGFCILGQRHTEQFVGGVDALGLDSGDSLMSHAFTALDSQEYSFLTELWVAVIQSRRYPRRKIAKTPFCIKANRTLVRV